MKSVHLLSPLLILLITTPGLMSSEIDEDEESSLKRRLLQRRIATVSNAERESRSRGGAAERPELPQLVSPGCTSCESCGTSLVLQDRRARILDGIETVYGAYPWQVSIEKRGQDTGERWSHICGGSLISKYHVLTAAHCFRDTLSDYRVIVGNHYLNKTDVSEQAFEIQPGDYVNHRGFGFRSEFDNDISFIRLPSPDDRGVAFDQYVHPICLPPEEGISLTPGLRCHVSGWGTQDKRRSHKVSSILRVAQVPLQSQGECQRAYRDDLRGNYLRRLYPINRHSVITDGNFCAGGDGPDACSGDSGGPLACTLPGQPHKFFLAGIVSWGKECGSKTHPGIYTKVSHYLKWIRNEVDLSRPDRLKL